MMTFYFELYAEHKRKFVVQQICDNNSRHTEITQKRDASNSCRLPRPHENLLGLIVVLLSQSYWTVATILCSFYVDKVYFSVALQLPSEKQRRNMDTIQQNVRKYTRKVRSNTTRLYSTANKITKQYYQMHSCFKKV